MYSVCYSIMGGSTIWPVARSVSPAINEITLSYGTQFFPYSILAPLHSWVAYSGHLNASHIETWKINPAFSLFILITANKLLHIFSIALSNHTNVFPPSTYFVTSYKYLWNWKPKWSHTLFYHIQIAEVLVLHLFKRTKRCIAACVILTWNRFSSSM